MFKKFFEKLDAKLKKAADAKASCGCKGKCKKSKEEGDK
jgi:hypothetical protein